MERGLMAEALAEFEKLDKEPEARESPDVFYHRGQLKFLSGQFAPAVEDYRKVLALDPDFIYGHIQLNVALYKTGETGECERGFRRAKTQFAQRAEVFHYHGEILADQQNLDGAEKLFDQAMELDPTSPLPVMNKG
jgi:import receptor subunit TOM70